MRQQALVRFLALKGLKAQEIEMKLTSVYGDEMLQISAGKTWRKPSLQGEQSSEMTCDRESPPILI
jgi:hypothetical protein